MEKLRNNRAVTKMVHLAAALGRCGIPGHAAYASYFLILAAFPALVLLLSLIRYAHLELEDLMELLREFFPGALIPYVERVVVNTYANTSGKMVGFSIFVVVWSASKGVYGVMRGLNSIYHVSENRSYLKTRLISFCYTIAFLPVLLLTLALHVFGTAIISLIPETNSPLLQLMWDVIDLRFFLLLGIQTLVFTVMFMFMPNRRNRLLDSIPGALLASMGWLIFSDCFSLYVEHFPKYANLYGSVYAVAMGMLWLYFCMSIVFYGGVLNQYVISHKNRKIVDES